MNNKHFRSLPGQSYALLLIVIATVFFSSKAIFIKLAYRYQVNPDTLVMLRMLFAAPFYIYFSISATRAYKQPISLRTFIAIAALCICGYYLASILDFYGLQYISAGLERLILYTYPALVLLFSALVFNRRISIATMTCIAVIYGGLMMVFFNDIHNSTQGENIHTVFGELSPTVVGSALVSGSAIMFAVYMTGSEYMMRTLPSRLFTSYGMLTTCIVVCLHFFLRQPAQLLITQPLPVYALACATAILCTVVPSFLLAAAVQRIGATTTSAAGSFGPVFTLILGYFLLDEPVTLMQLFGFAIVIAAVITLGKRKHRV